MPDTERCPMYKDFVRECIWIMRDMPHELDTMAYCTSASYTECPFYIFLQNPEAYCTAFKSCELCHRYKHESFEKLIQMANTWCLKDYTSCARYKTERDGHMPDPVLLPDGSMLKSES